MPKYLLSKEQSDYLVSIIEGRRVSEVTKRLNEHFGTSFTENQIDAYKHNHKLKSGINTQDDVLEAVENTLWNRLNI